MRTGRSCRSPTGGKDMTRSSNGFREPHHIPVNGRNPEVGEDGYRRRRRHDGLGMSLYAKRLEKGRFIWPSANDGVVALTSSQLACLLDGIDWRNPQYSWRPLSAG
ncbi:IS66 family insertion sequence hypothetical protein [Sphingomonas koreensis]|nr:IS66 family insertion sequence hypothetical protein [Sphingomonas koreensis]